MYDSGNFFSFWCFTVQVLIGLPVWELYYLLSKIKFFNLRLQNFSHNCGWWEDGGCRNEIGCRLEELMAFCKHLNAVHRVNILMPFVLNTDCMEKWRTYCRFSTANISILEFYFIYLFIHLHMFIIFLFLYLIVWYPHFTVFGQILIPICLLFL